MKSFVFALVLAASFLSQPATADPAASQQAWENAIHAAVAHKIPVFASLGCKVSDVEIDLQSQP